MVVLIEWVSEKKISGGADNLKFLSRQILCRNEKMRSVAAAVSFRKVRSTAFCSSRMGWAALQSRSLAIPVQVGHGDARKGQVFSPTSGGTIHERSPEQERAALLEYEQMTRATQRLMKLQTLAPSSMQELRVVFQYWVGGRSRAVLLPLKEQDTAMRNAEALLEWMLDTQKDLKLFQDVIRADGCPSGGMVNMMEQYLVPFRGTYQSFIVADRRLRHNRDVEELKKGLQNATRVMQHLQQLHDDPSFTSLVPDRYTCNMVLNLWVKRCWFLAEHGTSIDDEFIRTALNGVTSVEGCLEAMEQYLKLMKEQSNLPLPDGDAYTLVLSAWVSSKLPNMAEKAHAMLMKLENDPSITLKAVAYNAVLKAYASLARRDAKNAAHAFELLKHMRNKGIDCQVVTYSTVLLAYTNSGQPDKAMEFLAHMEEDSQRTQIFPNTVCYNTRAQNLLKWLQVLRSCSHTSCTLSQMYSPRCSCQKRNGRRSSPR